MQQNQHISFQAIPEFQCCHAGMIHSFGPFSELSNAKSQCKVKPNFRLTHLINKMFHIKSVFLREVAVLHMQCYTGKHSMFYYSSDITWS